MAPEQAAKINEMMAKRPPVVTSTMVEKIESKKLADSDFAIPAGLTKRELPTAPAGAGGMKMPPGHPGAPGAGAPGGAPQVRAPQVRALRVQVLRVARRRRRSESPKRTRARIHSTVASELNTRKRAGSVGAPLVVSM